MSTQPAERRQELDLPTLGWTVVIRPVTRQELLRVRALARQEGVQSTHRINLGLLKVGLVEPALNWKELGRFKNSYPSEAARIAAAITDLSKQ